MITSRLLLNKSARFRWQPFLKKLLKAVEIWQKVQSIAVLPILKIKNVKKFGLIKIYRHPMRFQGYEIPRGFVDKGETLKEAALRELQEESGIPKDQVKLKQVSVACPETGVIAAKIGIFHAHVSAKFESQPIEAELGHGKFSWFSEREISRLIKSQKILDAATLIALSFV